MTKTEKSRLMMQVAAARYGDPGNSCYLSSMFTPSQLSWRMCLHFSNLQISLRGGGVPPLKMWRLIRLFQCDTPKCALKEGDGSSAGFNTLPTHFSLSLFELEAGWFLGWRESICVSEERHLGNNYYAHLHDNATAFSIPLYTLQSKTRLILGLWLSLIMTN